MPVAHQRVALVTGSSRGLGAAIARRLARDGLAVAVNGRRGDERAGEVSGSIGDGGGVAEAFCADVTDEQQVADLVAAITGRFGPVDVLVLNATGPQPENLIADVGWADHLAQLDYFVKSPVLRAGPHDRSCGKQQPADAVTGYREGNDRADDRDRGDGESERQRAGEHGGAGPVVGSRDGTASKGGHDRRAGRGRGETAAGRCRRRALHGLMVHHVRVSGEKHLPGGAARQAAAPRRRRPPSTVIAATSPARDARAKVVW